MWIDDIINKLELAELMAATNPIAAAPPATDALTPDEGTDPRRHLLDQAGDEGLVGLYGAPATCRLLQLLDRVERASARGVRDVSEVEREYWATWQRVEVARQNADARGADGAGRRLLCELEALNIQWFYMVERAQAGFPSPSKEEAAYSAFQAIARRIDEIRLRLEQGYPALLDGLELFPEPDVSGADETNPLGRHLAEQGGWVGVAECYGTGAADRLFATVIAWERAEAPEMRTMLVNRYQTILQRIGLDVALESKNDAEKENSDAA